MTYRKYRLRRASFGIRDVASRMAGMAAQYKGDRKVFFSRLDAKLADRGAKKAQDQGLSISDYVAMLVARDIGQPELGPAIQEVLLPHAS